MTIILANGSFPQAPRLLEMLRTADRIVCCDGAATNLLHFGRIPDWIIGDLDSLESLPTHLQKNVIHVTEQDTNDLSKAFRFCIAQGWNTLTILGATGKREDHTLGNISLLADFALTAPDITLETDNGTFFPMLHSGTFQATPGDQISIFALDNDTAITSEGLKWPLNNLSPTRWWQATLNEATAPSVTLRFTEGKSLIVFRTTNNQHRPPATTP